eukprot:gene12027-12172_t
MLLIDPVCMAMFMPRLLHGFLYASLRLQITRPLAAIQQLMLWLVAKDIHLATTFARGFFWTDLNLWPEELPAGSTVVLGECDALVQAPEVANLLASNAGVKGQLIGLPTICAERSNDVLLLFSVEWGGSVTAAAAAVDAAVALSTRGCRKEFDQEMQQQNRAGVSIAGELQPVLS